MTAGRSTREAAPEMGRSLRILRRDDVRSALPMAACIDAVEAAFIDYSAGRAELPGVIHLDVPEAGGEIHVKAGHLHGAPAYAVKVASGFYGSEAAVIDGLVLVFDASDGAPVALLLDGGHLTDLRTGAAGGVAARHLAREDVRTVAVLGTGIQARMQVAALKVVRPGIERVIVWGRNPERAAAAAAAAAVVITCTAAREPLLNADDLRPGVHITAIGSDGVGKQELDAEIVRQADVVAVDSLDQCRRLGELQHALDRSDRAVELGAIAGGSSPGRTSDDQITVADLTGVGVQDVASANAVLANVAGGAGTRIDL